MTSIRHMGIVVSDMDKSIHFYTDLIGLEKFLLEKKLDLS